MRVFRPKNLPTKNVQNPFEIPAIFLKFTYISHQLKPFSPNYTQSCYTNVRTWINLTKITKNYTKRKCICSFCLFKLNKMNANRCKQDSANEIF